MLVKFQIVLDSREQSALGAFAERELRSVQNQARLIIRERLIKEGFLTADADDSADDPVPPLDRSQNR